MVQICNISINAFVSTVNVIVDQEIYFKQSLMTNQIDIIEPTIFYRFKE
ncbi:hypothetical protein pb186bvf_020205 [Paramecium bursaria]